MKMLESEKEICSYPFVKSDNHNLDGVKFIDLLWRVDGRGKLIEIGTPVFFNGNWLFPAHVYQTYTDKDVIKAWHVHKEHTDQFGITHGKLNLVLADIREQSSTFGKYVSVVIGRDNPMAVRVPPGVLHGWKALSHGCMVTNMQTHIYNPFDEIRYPFDMQFLIDFEWQPLNG